MVYNDYVGLAAVMHKYPLNSASHILPTKLCVAAAECKNRKIQIYRWRSSLTQSAVSESSPDITSDDSVIQTDYQIRREFIFYNFFGALCTVRCVSEAIHYSFQYCFQIVIECFSRCRAL